MDDDVIKAYIRIRYNINLSDYLTGVINIIMNYQDVDLNVSEIDRLLLGFPSYVKTRTTMYQGAGGRVPNEAELLEHYLMDIEEQYFDESLGNFEYDY